MNKYGNMKTEIDGIVFDSKKESKRYMVLKLLEKQGKIQNLKIKTRYELIPKNEKFRALSYISDFEYYIEGKKIVEDVKGYRGGAGYGIFTIKKKLMYHIYKIEITEV